MAQRATNKLKKDSSVKVANNKLPSSVSLAKVIELSKFLSRGKSRQYVIDYAINHYDVNEAQAKRYYSAAVRYLVPEDAEEYRQGLIQANFDRLETIVERAMEEGDWKNARETVAEINKMLGITKDGISVGIQTDKANDTQQVIIRFDK